MNPVKGITGQVETIYEEAISELGREEAETERQISELIENKAVLSKKREDVNNLWAQVEDSTKEIRAVEEEYQAQVKNKTELDVEIQQMTETLDQLNTDSQQMEVSLSETRSVKRAKYQSLAEMIEEFRDSVRNNRSDAVVAELKQALHDAEDGQPESALLSIPDEASPHTGDGADVTGDAAEEIQRTTASEANPSVSESEVELKDTLSDSETRLTQRDTEDSEVTFAAEEEDNLEDEAGGEPSRIQSVPRGVSAEAERLKEVFESQHSDIDGADELNLDINAPAEDEMESNFSDISKADMAEFDSLTSQIDLKGNTTEKNLLAIEDELQTLDEEAEEEKLTPRTAKTPRKRRNLLMSYLNNKNR
jgi:hypothetical protein